MPDIPFLPFWAEIIVWVLLGGMVLNLPLWLAADYQITRHRRRSFSFGLLCADIVAGVLWFLMWLALLHGILTGKAKPAFIPHLIGVAFGVKASFRFMDNHGYYD